MQCRRSGYDQVGLPFWEFDRYLNLQSQILSTRKSRDHRKTCPRLWDEGENEGGGLKWPKKEKKNERRCLFAGRKRRRKRLGVAETECTQSLCVLCGSKVFWISSSSLFFYSSS